MKATLLAWDRHKTPQGILAYLPEHLHIPGKIATWPQQAPGLDLSPAVQLCCRFAEKITQAHTTLSSLQGSHVIKHTKLSSLQGRCVIRKKNPHVTFWDGSQSKTSNSFVTESFLKENKDREVWRDSEPRSIPPAKNSYLEAKSLLGIPGVTRKETCLRPHSTRSTGLTCTWILDTGYRLK